MNNVLLGRQRGRKSSTKKKNRACKCLWNMNVYLNHLQLYPDPKQTHSQGPCLGSLSFPFLFRPTHNPTIVLTHLFSSCSGRDSYYDLLLVKTNKQNPLISHSVTWHFQISAKLSWWPASVHVVIPSWFTYLSFTPARYTVWHTGPLTVSPLCQNFSVWSLPTTAPPSL